MLMEFALLRAAIGHDAYLPTVLFTSSVRPFLLVIGRLEISLSFGSSCRRKGLGRTGGGWTPFPP